MSKNKQQQIDELNASIDYCCAMANLNCEWDELAEAKLANEHAVKMQQLDDVTSRINGLGANDAALRLYSEACKFGHVANANLLTIGQRWMWCAAQFRKQADALTLALLPALPVDELASLRAICKRILATHDYSEYAKGSVQELWREFQREVEK